MSAQLAPAYTQPGTQKFEGQLSQALTFNKQPPSVDGVSAGMPAGNDYNPHSLREGARNLAQCPSFGGTSRERSQGENRECFQ